MAKFSPGPMVAEVRGSVGGTTFTRNRYGQCTRFRAKPVVSVTQRALDAKARMTAATQSWQALTAAQRLAWDQWANGNPIVGKLGESQILTGHVAYVGVQCRRVVLGQVMVGDPPVTPAPAPLLTMTFVPNKTAGTLDVTFTATPPPAGCVLYVQACQHASAGKVWVENLLKGDINSGGPPASPWDAFAFVEARIGALIIGHTLHMKILVASGLTGLFSAPLRYSAVII